MMTANDLPCRRMSSGSSAAATSVVCCAPAGLTCVTRTVRAGVNPSGVGTRSRSDMIAQHQLAWMRFEVRLAGEILDAVQPDVVPQERHGNDEGHEAAAVFVDAVEQFLP